ncbi:MAG TPA: cupin domain-containing protein [Streptosporangiaceae bacterium]|jgi:quercetin dioxygenase-like cupin family protein
MEIVQRRDGAQPTEHRTATFTGEVYADPVLAADDTMVTSVLFAPGARTHWHSHASGQLLQVLDGRGLVCAEGGAPQPIGAGDMVWARPGEVHWHGGGPETMLHHIAVSLGATTWLGPVADTDYPDAR